MLPTSMQTPDQLDLKVDDVNSYLLHHQPFRRIFDADHALSEQLLQNSQLSSPSGDARFRGNRLCPPTSSQTLSVIRFIQVNRKAEL